jgi:hypothetical protein
LQGTQTLILSVPPSAADDVVLLGEPVMSRQQ